MLQSYCSRTGYAKNDETLFLKASYIKRICGLKAEGMLLWISLNLLSLSRTVYCKRFEILFSWLPLLLHMFFSTFSCLAAWISCPEGTECSLF